MPYQFDTACMSRLSPEVAQVLVKYRLLESIYSARELHRFHISGFDESIDRGKIDGSLSNWRGFDALEKSLVELLNLNRTNSLLQWGVTTGEIFRWIVSTCASFGPFFWTDDLYYPWRLYLSDAKHHEKLQGDCVPVRASVIRDGRRRSDGVAHLIADQILEKRPRVVFLSAVTQGGVRMPIETALRVLRDKWHPSKMGDMPLFVLDGCQAYGRVPFDMSSEVQQDVRGMYIGCLHKALRGPKQIGFAVCTNATWRARLSRERKMSWNGSNIFSYARSRGTALGLPTLDCSGAIGGAAALLNQTFQRNCDEFPKMLTFTERLRTRLQNTAWQVRTPEHPDWNSGVVLIEPPTRMSIKSRHGIQEYFDDISIDQLDDCIRVSFDESHTELSVERLAERLLTWEPEQ